MFNELDKSVFDVFNQEGDYEEGPQNIAFFCNEKGLSPKESTFIAEALLGGEINELSTVLQTEMTTREAFNEAYEMLQASGDYEDPENMEFLNEDGNDTLSAENVLGIAGLLQDKDSYTDASDLVDDLKNSLETVVSGEREVSGGTIRNILNTLVGINKKRRTLPGSKQYPLRVLAFNASDNLLVAGLYPNNLKAFSAPTFTDKFFDGVISKIKNVKNSDPDALGKISTDSYEIFFTKGVAQDGSNDGSQLSQLTKELINPQGSKGFLGFGKKEAVKPTQVSFDPKTEWAEKDSEGTPIVFHTSKNEVKMAERMLNMSDEELTDWVTKKVGLEASKKEEKPSSKATDISLEDLQQNDALVKVLVKLFGQRNLDKVLQATSEDLQENPDETLGDAVNNAAEELDLKTLNSKNADTIDEIGDDIIEDTEDTDEMVSEIQDDLDIESTEDAEAVVQTIADTLTENPDASVEEVADQAIENVKTDVSTPSYNKIKKNKKKSKQDIGNFVKKYQAKLRAKAKAEFAEYDMTQGEELTFNDLQKISQKKPDEPLKPSEQNPIKVRTIDPTGKKRVVHITNKYQLSKYLPRLEQDFLSDGEKTFVSKSAYNAAMRLRKGGYEKEDVYKVLDSFMKRIDPKYKGEPKRGISKKTIKNKGEMTKALRQLGLIEKRNRLRRALSEGATELNIYLTNGGSIELDARDINKVIFNSDLGRYVQSLGGSLAEMDRKNAGVAYYIAKEIGMSVYQLFRSNIASLRCFMLGNSEELIEHANDILLDYGSNDEIDYLK